MFEDEEEKRKERLNDINRLFGNTNLNNNVSNDYTSYEKRINDINKLFNIDKGNSFNISNSNIKRDELQEFLKNQDDSTDYNNNVLTVKNIVSENEALRPKDKENKEDKKTKINTSPTVNANSSTNFREQNKSNNIFKVDSNNVKVATSEESKNIKIANDTDVYLLSGGEVDYRDNAQKKIDMLKGIGGNVSEGINDFVPSIIDYISSGNENGARNTIKRGLKWLGYSDTELEEITNIAMENYKNMSPLSILNYLLNNENKQQARNDRINRNTLLASSSPIAKKLAELAPSIGDNVVSMGLTAVNPVLGTASFILSAGGSYLDDARARGMNDDQAFGYATVMGIFEGGTEAVISGSMVDKIGRKFLGKGLSDEVLNSFGVSATENFFQEAIMEPLQEGTATIFGGKDAANWDNIWGRFFESGVDGILSAIILGGASVGIASAENVVNKVNPTGNDYNKAIVDTLNSGKVDVKGIIEGAQQAIISNENMQTFYTATLNQDGSVENVQAVRGKIIENPNKKVKVTPVIIKNQENSYNIIDRNTGLLLDSFPYQTLIEAQASFDNKIINLDEATVNNINSKIVQTDIAINQEISKVQSEMNADRNIKSDYENVMNIAQSRSNNVNAYSNIDTDTNSNTEINTNVDTNNVYQTPQNQFTDNKGNNTQNYISNPNTATNNKNNGLDDVTKLVTQISDNAIYNREETGNIFRFAAKSIPNIELQVNDNTTYINSFDRNGNVTYQQQIPNRTLLGGEIRDIINNVINNADLSNINMVQTSQNEFRGDLSNEMANYAFRRSNKNVERNNSYKNVSNDLLKNIDNVLSGTIDRNRSIKVLDDTPLVLQRAGLKDLPVIMTQDHIRTTIFTKEEALSRGLKVKNKNYHGLGKEVLLKVIDNIDNPIAIYQWQNNNQNKYGKDNYIIITQFKDKNNDRIIVPVLANKKDNNYITVNKIKSTYGKIGLSNYLKKNLESGNIKQIYNKKELDKSSGGIQYSSERKSNSSSTSIPQTNENVKSNTSTTNKSMQNNKNNTQNIQKELHNRIQNAILSRNSRKNTFLGTVSDKVANKIKSLFGIDVSGRKHIISDYDIRHMIKQHGNTEIEKTKGQIAITTKDIEKIPDIIENYDRIEKGSLNTNNITGKPSNSIRYIKEYEDNTTYVVEIVPETGNTLQIKTMWKKHNKTKKNPIGLSHDKNNVPPYTSETKSNSGSSKSIPHNRQNVKDNGIRAERTSAAVEYDNQGNKLTKAQREFFKNSKVRDENGKLKIVYHGTNNDFTIFDRNKSGQSNSNAKIGFWFTETKEGAKRFAESVWYGNKKNSEVFEVYLDIKNPKIYKSIDNSKELNTLEEKMTDLKQKIRQIENRNINIEINSSAIKYASDETELIDIAKQNGIIKGQDEFVSTAKEYKKLLNNYDNTEIEYNNKRYNDAYELFRTDIYKIAGKDANDANFGGTGMWLENEFEILQKYKSNLKKQGYDGIIIQGTNYDSETMGRNNTQYVAFNADQIKNVTNVKPTSNPDIRYERTSKTTQPYDARRYEKNADFVNYLKDNNYLNTLMEVDNQQGETYAHNFERRIEQEIRNVESTGAFDNTIPVTKLSDISKMVEDFLGTKIQKGHFRQRARGIYNSKTDSIRVKEYKDMDNVLHEMGHALDLGDRIKIDKESIANELLDAVKKHGGYENDSRTIQLDEGFAELVKEYAINPTQTKLDYPQTYSILETERQQNVEFNKFMSNLQSQIYNYIHQNPRNRILSNQSIGEQTDKSPVTPNSMKENVIKWIWDRDYTIKEMTNGLANGAKLNPSQNVYLLTRLASGVNNKAISMISNGYIDLNGNRAMPGLNKLGEILGNDSQRWNDLRAFLVAKRDLEYKAESLKTGIRTMDSKAVVEQFYNDAQIQEATQVVYDTLDGVLQYAIDNGLINKETANSLRESNAFYVPFQRVIDGRGNQTGKKGTVNDILHKRTGSELDIKDVLENIVANSANIIQQVENNNILRTLDEQGEAAGIKNNIFEEISTPVKKIGTEQLSTWEAELKRQGVDTSNLELEKTIDIFVPNNNIITEKDGSHIVSYIDNQGNRKYLQFYKDSTDIFNALMGMDKNTNSTFLKIMRAANMPLRYGATMANVGFAIPNMISDTVQATIYSEAGFIPVVDNVLGVLDVLGATNKSVRNFLNKYAPEYAERVNRLYDIYQQTGASSSTRMSQYRKSTQEIMEDIYGTNSKSLGIKDSFKPLKRLMDLLTYIPELSESSTRFRVFERNYNAALNKGMSEADARLQAAIESRDATQDFGRTGTVMREINQIIPFSAARVGSAYTFAEKMKANPKRTSARIAILLTVAMAIKAIGYDDDEIEELNQRKKDDNFVIKIGDTVLTIKKPQGILRSLVNLTEYIQDLVTGHIDKGKEWDRLGNWLNNAIMDNMPADEVGGLVPNAIAPIVENSVNKDFYYNNDIVKSWDLDLPDEQQYYDYTSQLAIWLGQIFNYSPAKIDNLISGYLGGLGTQITNTIDWISGKMGLSAEEPSMGAEDNAIGKRFVVNVNENSSSVDEIYSREEELTKKLNGGTITEKENVELENIKAGISKLSALNKQIKAIKQDLTMSGAEKADAIRPLQEQKTDVARQALGKEPIYTENTDNLEALEFYPSRSTLSYNGLTLNLTEDMKQEYMNTAYTLYKQYKNQGLYSEDYLEKLKNKVKDAAKKSIMQKYKSKLVE